jgi:hypothetical protein
MTICDTEPAGASTESPVGSPLFTNREQTWMVVNKEEKWCTLPVAVCLVHHIAPLLPLKSLSSPTSYWLPNCPFPLPIGCWTLPPL